MSLAIRTRKQSFVRLHKKKCVAVAWNLFLCPISISNNASSSAVIAYLNALIFLIFNTCLRF